MKVLATCRFVSHAWLVGALALVLAFRSVGEASPAVAALLYLPPSIWLLPLAVLLPVALLLRDVHLLISIALTTLLMIIWLFGFSWCFAPPVPPANALVVKLITHNTGERGNTSLQPFISRIQPDFLLLQDAPARARRYRAAPGYEQFPYADDAGEFTLISRYPILSKELIARDPTSVPRMMHYPIGARFEVDVGGQTIAIYNIHAFSPRPYLSGTNMPRAIFYSVAGWPGTRWAEPLQQLKTFWSAQQAAAELLAQRISGDRLPCIVAGDLNAPPQGRIHRRMMVALQDAHLEAGRGCGFTFPGVTRNPLSLFGPWLRLDYVLASRHWLCLASEVEPHNPSQHRALASTLALPRP